MSSATQKASDAQGWTRRGDDLTTRSWGREREPGTASRGISRGRGRGGGGFRGRVGGRGGGGRSVSTRGTPDSRSTPPPLPGKPDVNGGPAANNSTQVKGRETPKMLNGAQPAVDAQVSQSSDSGSPLSPGKPSRRRRNTHKRAASAALPKPLSATLTDALPTSPSVPLMPSIKDMKDAPPHIESATDSGTHVHDLRQDISDLVNHVRTMAMDNNRPTSPSTHIDWAGDDADSLPDLDDWGVSSKLTSEVDEAKATAEADGVVAVATDPETTSGSAPTTLHASKSSAVQPAVVDGIQSSAESPTETSSSLSAPPPMRRERERRRERGSRRDKEKRAQQTNGVNGIQAAQPTVSIIPKKSLLERLSSPVRAELPALPRERAPSPKTNRTDVASVSGSNLPHHPSLPPKPVCIPEKPKVLDTWRSNRQSPPSKDNENAPASEPTPSKVCHDGAAAPHQDPPRAGEKVEIVGASNKSSFDWSEEPVASDAPLDSPKVPPVLVEPASPSRDQASIPTTTPSTNATVPPSSPRLPPTGPRSRMQRPLSGDITHSSRRDRSPYKTHNPRNHSAPHAGPARGAIPPGRVRPQRTSRPIIRVDALQMLERNLRGERHLRKSSPASKATESEMSTS